MLDPLARPSAGPLSSPQSRASPTSPTAPLPPPTEPLPPPPPSGLAPAAAAPLPLPFNMRSDAELQDAIQALFDRWDVDRSGVLSLAEFRRGVTQEAQSRGRDPTVQLVAAAVEAASPERQRS